MKARRRMLGDLSAGEGLASRTGYGGSPGRAGCRGQRHAPFNGLRRGRLAPKRDHHNAAHEQYVSKFRRRALHPIDLLRRARSVAKPDRRALSPCLRFACRRHLDPRQLHFRAFRQICAPLIDSRRLTSTTGHGEARRRFACLATQRVNPRTPTRPKSGTAHRQKERRSRGGSVWRCKSDQSSGRSLALPSTRRLGN